MDFVETLGRRWQEQEAKWVGDSVSVPRNGREHRIVQPLKSVRLGAAGAKEGEGDDSLRRSDAHHISDKEVVSNIINPWIHESETIKFYTFVSG